MASAQVLPNSSRKQGHLEAGKRRLEEFRKKKAAERAKKVSSNSQPNASNVSSYEKLPLDIDQVRVTDSAVVGTSDGTERAVTEANHVDNILTDAQNSELGSLKDSQAKTTFLENTNNAISVDPAQTFAKDQDFIRFDTAGVDGPAEISYNDSRTKIGEFGFYSGSQGRVARVSNSNKSDGLHQETIRDTDSNAGQSTHNGIGETQSQGNNSPLKDFIFLNSGTSRVPDANDSFDESGSFLPQNKSGYGSKLESDDPSLSYKDSIDAAPRMASSAHELRQHDHVNSDVYGSVIRDMWEQNLSSSVGISPNVKNSPLQMSESFSKGLNLDSRNSPNHVPLPPTMAETNTRRSRPSFLDSLNISRASNSPFSHTEQENPLSYITNTPELPRRDFQASSFQKPFPEEQEPLSELRTQNGPAAFERAMNSSVSTPNGDDKLGLGINEFGIERKQEFHSQKQDEDFSALEQHIEDLTQEKFSLQRALEASRALAESLAAENSSLTDSYNQQGGIVNQLRSDMEKLQEEIQAQLVELESVKAGYANAQLECNAADERARLLASEVIGLEEKALRLRSSELKMERHLEKSQAEISSWKKKMSSLERERLDLQSTVDALQEEKKLLLSKLRKASVSGKSVDTGSIPRMKKEASTSTEDLVHEDSMPRNASNLEMSGSTSLRVNDFSNLPLLPANGLANLEASSVNIPSDQTRMIQNINTLISELSLEKEELMQALTTESSNNSKMKELNDELSRKLEVQTQRLELLTAQNMANESIPARQPNSRTLQENTAYADEGDEVVERVLGWIMKLFPGGPSRRRTSKLL